MIKVEIIGNIAKNVREENYNGRRVIQFGVCTSEGYKDAITGEWKTTSTTWITCFKDIYDRVNVPLLEALQHAKKVFVRGTLHARIAKDRAGQNVVGLSCNVDDVEICSTFTPTNPTTAQP